MKYAKAALIAGLFAAQGCVIGTNAVTWPEAHAPSGIQTAIRLTAAPDSMQGELLAVQDTALIVLRWGPSGKWEAAMVRMGSIREAKFPALGGREFIVNWKWDSADGRERVTLLARFPQGMTAELLGKVLAAYGQDSLAGIR